MKAESSVSPEVSEYLETMYRRQESLQMSGDSICSTIDQRSRTSLSLGKISRRRSTRSLSVISQTLLIELLPSSRDSMTATLVKELWTKS